MRHPFTEFSENRASSFFHNPADKQTNNPDGKHDLLGGVNNTSSSEPRVWMYKADWFRPILTLKLLIIAEEASTNLFSHS